MPKEITPEKVSLEKVRDTIEMLHNLETCEHCEIKQTEKICLTCRAIDTFIKLPYEKQMKFLRENA